MAAPLHSRSALPQQREGSTDLPPTAPTCHHTVTTLTSPTGCWATAHATQDTHSCPGEREGHCYPDSLCSKCGSHVLARLWVHGWVGRSMGLGRGWRPIREAILSLSLGVAPPRRGTEASDQCHLRGLPIGLGHRPSAGAEISPSPEQHVLSTATQKQSLLHLSKALFPE